MGRKTGYLANLDNIPPLIFRFQVNPEIMSEKKSYKYEVEKKDRKWDFEKTRSGSGLGAVTGFYDDLKNFGPQLVNTKSLNAIEGEQRSFSLDFKLYSNLPRDKSGTISIEGDDNYVDTIEPYLAVLRSFMYPSWALTDTIKLFKSEYKKRPPNPPECKLVYGGVSTDCVMTDLNIKITGFKSDGKPDTADVSITLKEQTNSVGPIGDFISRMYNVAQSYRREDYTDLGFDAIRTAPFGIGTIMNLFDV